MKKIHETATGNYINACGVVESGGEKRENYHTFSPTAAEAESPWLNLAADPLSILLALWLMFLIQQHRCFRSNIYIFVFHSSIF